MDNKTIDRIVWWIPLKQLRNDIREILYCIKNTNDIVTKISSKENVIRKYRLSNIDLYFYDSIISCTTNIVSHEIEKYNFDKIDFKDGDVVIDIGANVGMVSIYLAKKYPFLKIYSFEPVKQNYENLLRNIEINNIPNGIIIAENIAITKDRRNIDIITPLENSGGSSAILHCDSGYMVSNINLNIKSITFDDIFEKYNIDKCKLLKIDCEGSEYEILYNANENNIKKCNNMRGEFHGNKEDQKKLYEYCLKYINDIEYQEAIC